MIFIKAIVTPMIKKVTLLYDEINRVHVKSADLHLNFLKAFTVYYVDLSQNLIISSFGQVIPT